MERINVTRSLMPSLEEYVEEISSMWETHWLTNMGEKHQRLEKQLKEYGDKIPADKKSLIEAALSALKYAHEQQDIPGIDRASADLNTAWTAASEDMYKTGQQDAAARAQSGNGQPGSGSEAGGGAEDVTDMPFEDIK